jgi:hypothetical protein
MYFADGVQATPGIAFSGAHSTGIWRSNSSGNLAVSVAGTLGTYWDSTGLATITAATVSGNLYGAADARLASTSTVGWSSTADPTAAADTGIKRNTAGTAQITNGSTGNGALYVSGTASANGQTFIIESVSSNVTLNTGSTTTNGPQIPLDAIVMDVTARVTTTITTAVSWSVGVGGATTRYVNANATMTAGTTATGLDNPRKYTAATNTVITTNANPGAGAIRITIHYMKATAPTS